MSKEAKARIKINKLLEESGWNFVDTENVRLKDKNLLPTLFKLRRL